MIELFDFEDGYGQVPAHSHKNKNGEMGGWVSENARVFGNA